MTKIQKMKSCKKMKKMIFRISVEGKIEKIKCKNKRRWKTKMEIYMLVVMKIFGGSWLYIIILYYLVIIADIFPS